MFVVSEIGKEVATIAFKRLSHHSPLRIWGKPWTSWDSESPPCLEPGHIIMYLMQATTEKKNHIC
jgi:hypothetical protein